MKTYTEQDLRLAFQAGSERGAFIQAGNYFDAPLDEDEYIESLNPKIEESNMDQKFKLTNVVLYAKGWYKKTDNIWEDLRKILELDDYTPFDKMDVYSIILSRFQESNIYRITELKEVLNGIHPNNCWKYGYYTKESEQWAGKGAKIHEYDMPTAFVYYVLSSLRFIDNKFWNPQMPKVTKYPKADHITIRSLYEHFNKK